MEGDVLWYGEYLESESPKPTIQKNQIYTYSSIQGADSRSTAAYLENGGTEFKVLLQLRQRAGSYEKQKAATVARHELWATDIRGTILIEALCVHVLSAKGIKSPEAVISIIPPGIPVKKCHMQKRLLSSLRH